MFGALTGLTFGSLQFRSLRYWKKLIRRDNLDGRDNLMTRNTYTRGTCKRSSVSWSSPHHLPIDWHAGDPDIMIGCNRLRGSIKK